MTKTRFDFRLDLPHLLKAVVRPLQTCRARRASARRISRRDRRRFPLAKFRAESTIRAPRPRPCASRPGSARLALRHRRGVRNGYSPCASMKSRTCSTACRASAGSVPPRSASHCSNAHAAASRASPSGQGVTSKSDGQFARRRDQAEPLRHTLYLPVRARPDFRSRRNSAIIVAHVVAGHVLVNHPAHEFRPGAFHRPQAPLLDRLGQLARVAVLPAMIEHAEAARDRREYPACGLIARRAPCARDLRSISASNGISPDERRCTRQLFGSRKRRRARPLLARRRWPAHRLPPPPRAGPARPFRPE